MLAPGKSNSDRPIIAADSALGFKDFQPRTCLLRYLYFALLVIGSGLSGGDGGGGGQEKNAACHTPPVECANEIIISF